MALGSHELYELFLALSPARLAAARRALEHPEGDARQRELMGALVPLAVDAALLGAEGLSALAGAAAHSVNVPDTLILEALDALDRAIAELGQGDASGARVDEAALAATAQRLKRASQAPLGPAPAVSSLPRTPPQATPPPSSWGEDDRPPETRASGTPFALTPSDGYAAAPPLPPASALPKEAAPAIDPELSGVEYWQPQLADDMVAAFLDECAERTEALATRLLDLEERGADPELVGEIFRDLHTLKGSSGFAGLRKLNRVAHVAEDLIGQLRSGERAPDRVLIDLLLETLEVQNAILELARADQPIDIDVADLVARLRDPGRPRREPAGPIAEAQLPEGVRPAAAPAETPGERPAGSPSQGPAGFSIAPPARGSQRPRAQATLRIDFEKVDLLLNLVGEIVLSRGQLSASQEGYGHLLREVASFRGRLATLLGEASVHLQATGTDASAHLGRRGEPDWPATAIDDVQRIERVLSESYAEFESHLSRLGLAVGQLRDTVMKLRMVPIARLFTKYQRTVRELSHQLRKQVRVELLGADTELDKVLVERLEDPLLHLVRNAVDHGIEAPEKRLQAGKPAQGLVRLSASQQGGQIVVVIRDDGGGLDAARLKQKAVEKGLLRAHEIDDLPDSKAFDLIFHPGFSTAAEVSDVSGRGVGMDVVRNTIEKLKGGILIRSEAGVGTEFELRLPLTLAITQVLAVRVGSELVALPLDAVMSAQTLDASEVEAVASSACVRVGEDLIPVVHLGSALGLTREPGLGETPQGSVIIVHVGTDRLGLLVQHVLGRHEVVIKSLGPLLAKTPCAAGATLIGDRIALVVDLVGISQRLRDQAGLSAPAPAMKSQRPQPEGEAFGKVLIAEDSDVVRESLERELTRAGFRVVAAPDGREALDLARIQSFDAVCTDIMMPNLDGYQLIRALRQLPDYKTVPIVVLSSKDARIDSLRGLDAGADAYLSKPADPGQLIRELVGLLARRAT